MAQITDAAVSALAAMTASKLTTTPAKVNVVDKENVLELRTTPRQDAGAADSARKSAGRRRALSSVSQVAGGPARKKPRKSANRRVSFAARSQIHEYNPEEKTMDNGRSGEEAWEEEDLTTLAGPTEYDDEDVSFSFSGKSFLLRSVADVSDVDKENATAVAADGMEMTSAVGGIIAAVNEEHAGAGVDHDDDEGMDMTRAVGGIIKEASAAAEEEKENVQADDGMDMTPAVGGIIKAAQGDADQENATCHEDDGMDMTRAVGGILEEARSEAEKENVQVDQGMDMTRAVGGIIAEAQNEAAAEPDQDGMEMTRAVGGIIKEAQVDHSKENEILAAAEAAAALTATADAEPVDDCMDMTRAVGGIIKEAQSKQDKENDTPATATEPVDDGMDMTRAVGGIIKEAQIEVDEAPTNAAATKDKEATAAKPKTQYPTPLTAERVLATLHRVCDAGMQCLPDHPINMPPAQLSEDVAAVLTPAELENVSLAAEALLSHMETMQEELTMLQEQIKTVDPSMLNEMAQSESKMTQAYQVWNLDAQCSWTSWYTKMETHVSGELAAALQAMKDDHDTLSAALEAAKVSAENIEGDFELVGMPATPAEDPTIEAERAHAARMARLHEAVAEQEEMLTTFSKKKAEFQAKHRDATAVRDELLREQQELTARVEAQSASAAAAAAAAGRDAESSTAGAVTADKERLLTLLTSLHAWQPKVVSAERVCVRFDHSLELNVTLSSRSVEHVRTVELSGVDSLDSVMRTLIEQSDIPATLRKLQRTAQLGETLSSVALRLGRIHDMLEEVREASESFALQHCGVDESSGQATASFAVASPSQRVIVHMDLVPSYPQGDLRVNVVPHYGAAAEPLTEAARAVPPRFGRITDVLQAVSSGLTPHGDDEQ